MRYDGAQPSRSPQGLRGGCGRQIVVRRRHAIMRSHMRVFFLAGWVVVAASSATRGVDAGAEVPVTAGAAGERLRPYLAQPLDLEGHLVDALPLYRSQAEATLTKADRL